MNVELTKIVGLSTTFAQNLKKASITDAFALASAADTPEKRAALAEKTGEAPIMLYAFAKQAELLRCDTVDPREAEAIVRAGIRCVDDLKKADPEKLANFLFDNGIYTKLNEYDALEWVSSAMSLEGGFVPDPQDQPNWDVMTRSGLSTSMKHSSAYGSDLSEIITELGIGIAQAQRNLDEASLGIQREILADPEMSALGFNATWYAIPEASFTLKMEYTYSETGEKRISVVPMNASYNNVFRTKRAEESTLTLKFVPVPAPERLTERVTVPAVAGLTLEQAVQTVEDAGLTAETAIPAPEPLLPPPPLTPRTQTNTTSLRRAAVCSAPALCRCRPTTSFNSSLT